MIALCCRTLWYSASSLTVCVVESCIAFPSRHKTAWHLPTLAAFRVKQPPCSPRATGSCLIWHNAAEPPILWPAVPSFLKEKNRHTLSCVGGGCVCTCSQSQRAVNVFSVLLKESYKAVCLPLHGEESVGHIIFAPLGPVKLLCQHVSHGALQQVRHLNVLVSVKNAIQSFTDPTEAVEGQSSHTQPEDTKIATSILYLCLIQRDRDNNRQNAPTLKMTTLLIYLNMFL